MELYLVSADYKSFEKPIKVINWEKMIVLGSKCLLVNIEKELHYPRAGIQKAISRFILVDRFDRERLHKFEAFPIEVHVLIANDLDKLKEINTWKELYNVAWANVYNSYEAALADNED